MRARGSRAKLELVDEPSKDAVEEPIDIYAADNARIAAIDWGQVQIRGDRRAPVFLPDKPVRRLLVPGLETKVFRP